MMSHPGADPTAAAPLRVAIVDDEPLARDCVRLALESQPDVTIVGEARDGGEAVTLIRAHAPDVVFLDVQMPEVDGFGVVDALGPADAPVVVFVTAFDTHAIRAFEVHALDYVLKPFDDRRLLAALERARAALRERRRGELGRRLEALLRDWDGHQAPAAAGAGATAAERGVEEPAPARPAAPYATRFAVREDGRVRFVAAERVDWIEADRNYVVLHAGAERYRMRATIGEVLGKLDPMRFVRIHRSAVVNVDRVREVQPWFGGDYVAILHGGEKLRVSRQRAAQLLRPMT